MRSAAIGESIAIPVGQARIEADLRVPAQASGLVMFAHGSGSSRFSPRNRIVAESLEVNGFGTLLLDLLTSEEEADRRATRANIASTSIGWPGAWRSPTDWAPRRARISQSLPDRLLRREHRRGRRAGRGRRTLPTPCEPSFHAADGRIWQRAGFRHVLAPTLLIVGGDDEPVIGTEPRRDDGRWPPRSSSPSCLAPRICSRSRGRSSK